MKAARLRHPLKAILLLSGGFDSPVAGRMLVDQGWDVTALHASLEPLTDATSVAKTVVLAKWLGIPLHITKIGLELAKIPHHRGAHRFYFVLQKRLLLRLADKLADEIGADVIVTGENLGQVSSQTLSCMTAVEPAAKRPIVRPLLGLDKSDIIALAKEYGCHDVSVGPELCDTLGPNKPATRAKAEAVLKIEEHLALELPPIVAA